MIPRNAYLWNENARNTVWDLGAYRARHPMPFKPVPAPKPEPPKAPPAAPKPAPTMPAFQAEHDGVVFLSESPIDRVGLNRPVSKMALLEVQIQQLEADVTFWKGEHDLKDSSLDQCRTACIDHGVVRGAVDVRIHALGDDRDHWKRRALAAEAALAAHRAQNEPGEPTTDHSVAQTGTT